MDFTVNDLSEICSRTDRDVIIEDGGKVVSFVAGHKRNEYYEQTKT